jgi:hypothetical protein
MGDAAGLLLGALVDVAPLEAGQGLDGAQRQLRVEDQAHVRGEDGVAPAQRQEPRGAGRDHGPLGEVRVENPQAAKVVGAASQGGEQSVVIGGHLGHAALPAVQPPTRLAPLHRRAQRVPRRQLRPGDDGRDHDAEGSGSAGGDDRLPGQEARRHHDALGGADPAPQPRSTLAASEDQLGAFRSARGVGAEALERRLDRFGVEAAVAQLVRPRQVGSQLDGDLHIRRLLAGVADLDVVPHALAEESAPDDDGPVGGPALGSRRMPPAHERPGRGVVDVTIDRHQGPAVDRHDAARQQPVACHDQSLDADRDVAGGP